MYLGSKTFLFVIFVALCRTVVGEVPMFRILAPEFLCPRDSNTQIEKPDNTIITVKTEAQDLILNWIVRWVPLERPSQRLTLLMWKTVRALEKKLNAAQPESFVYIIDNTELLSGVEYIFNVTARDSISTDSITKSFKIDNIKGDPTLLIEGRSEKFSVLLFGADSIFVDLEYIVEAVVTTCSPTQDYYFSWSVQSLSGSLHNYSDTSGNRLEIPLYSLQAGSYYTVFCRVYINNGEFVIQTSLPLQVLYRGLAVNLNFDVLVVTTRNGFDIVAVVENHDHYNMEIQFVWSCNYGNEPCVNFESADNEIISFSNGLHNTGIYDISVMVFVEGQEATNNATIIVIEPILPVIKIEPQQRVVNENSIVTLTANVSNVIPSCILAWYFADEDYLGSVNYTLNNNQDGIELSGSLTITSLEENFLNELVDFTNQTERREIEAQVPASTGRARFVARCGDLQENVYADVNLVLNESPKVSEIKISPEIGTAMETIFRISTLLASDPNKPLRYSFYCSLGINNTLLLASNLEHLAAEVFLPYVDSSGTKFWVEVCDSLGACSSSKVRSVRIKEGEGRTLSSLVIEMQGHVNRCEVMPLNRLVKSAITTYKNAGQEQALSDFSKALIEALTTEDVCIKNNQDYAKLLDWLTQVGLDTNSLIE